MMVKRFLMLAGLICVVICGGWAYTSLNNYRAGLRTAEFNADVDDLFYALQKYKEYTGTYPRGNNVDVMRAWPVTTRAT